MKVAVIGCTSSEIISACYITITSLAKQGHTIYAIIARAESPESPSSSSSSLSEGANISELAAIGITQAFLIDRFDYSTVTQTNANAVNSHIKTLKPTLVIMPSWKSPNHLRKILARTSLIACRGIGTILMYELDVNNNTSFNPTITFGVSMNPSLMHYRTNNVTGTTTTSSTNDQNEIDDTKTSINNSMLEGRDSIISGHELLEEKFESHRTLLVEEEGLF
jgi:hypothetical protein